MGTARRFSVFFLVVSEQPQILIGLFIVGVVHHPHADNSQPKGIIPHNIGICWVLLSPQWLTRKNHRSSFLLHSSLLLKTCVAVRT